MREVIQLKADDLRKCQDLAVDRDWPLEDVKWRLLFDIGAAYGIPDGDALAACTVLTKLDTVAAVSMVLVASRFGRQGLGRRTMTHVLEQAEGRLTLLHATPYGRPLYESLGFGVAGGVVVHRGTIAGLPSGDTREANSADHAAIRALDRRAWGADRGVLLDRLLMGHVRVAEHNGEIAGYAVGSDHGHETMIGPILAADERMATALASDTARAAGGPVRIDADVRAEVMQAALRQAGLTPRLPATPMMVRGQMPGDEKLRYAPAMQALG